MRAKSEPKPYTVAGEARDVLQALDAQSVEAAHVVGHSYGALIALEAAAEAPEKVRSLHLIEPPLLALLPNDVDVQNMAESVREIYRCAEMWTAEEITLAFFSHVASPEFAASLPEKTVWPELVAGAKRLAHQQFPGDYSADVLARIDSELTVQVYRGEKSHPALRKLAAAVAESSGSSGRHPRGLSRCPTSARSFPPGSAGGNHGAAIKRKTLLELRSSDGKTFQEDRTE